jgi:hypothetical protein
VAGCCIQPHPLVLNMADRALPRPWFAYHHATRGPEAPPHPPFPDPSFSAEMDFGKLPLPPPTSTAPRPCAHPRSPVFAVALPVAALHYYFIQRHPMRSKTAPCRTRVLYGPTRHAHATTTTLCLQLRCAQYKCYRCRQQRG